LCWNEVWEQQRRGTIRSEDNGVATGRRRVSLERGAAVNRDLRLGGARDCEVEISLGKFLGRAAGVRRSFEDRAHVEAKNRVLARTMAADVGAGR